MSGSCQAIMLWISRGSVHYKPRPVLDANLKVMHRTEKLHMEYPFAGSRMVQGLFVQEGFKVERLRVATQIRRIWIESIYRRPNTSTAVPRNKISPIF